MSAVAATAFPPSTLPTGITYKDGCGPTDSSSSNSSSSRKRDEDNTGENETELRIRSYDLNEYLMGEEVDMIVKDLKSEMKTNTSTLTYIAVTTVTCGKGDAYSPGTLFRIKKILNGVQRNEAYNDTLELFGPVDNTNSLIEGAKPLCLKMINFVPQLPEIDEDSLPSMG